MLGQFGGVFCILGEGTSRRVDVTSKVCKTLCVLGC